MKFQYSKYIIAIFSLLLFSQLSSLAIEKNGIKCIPLKGVNLYRDEKDVKLDSYTKESSKNPYRYLLVPGEPTDLEASELSEMINPNNGKTARTTLYIPR